MKTWIKRSAAQNAKEIGRIWDARLSMARMIPDQFRVHDILKIFLEKKIHGTTG
jgi:hypothetical protein